MSDHAYRLSPKWVANIVINELSPVIDKIWKKDISYLQDQLLLQFTFDLMELYFKEIISKKVFREMLERRCWFAKLSRYGLIEDVHAFRKFAEASEHFKEDANMFEYVEKE